MEIIECFFSFLMLMELDLQLSLPTGNHREIRTKMLVCLNEITRLYLRTIITAMENSWSIMTSYM